MKSTAERRARHASASQGRHRGETTSDSFERGFAALAELALAGVQVSARAVDLASDRVLLSVDDHVVMPTASIGKVLLLIEVAAQLEQRQSAGFTLLDRETRDAVGESGVWQHLAVPSLPIADLAALVGAASDNLATNVLLRRIGLDAVSARTEQLGLTRTALLDLVRNHRGPDDAPQLSVGSAAELTWLFGALARGSVVDRDVSERVVQWLSLNADVTLVAGAFGLDPFAHRGADHGIMLINKTGADVGVRSEVGVLRGPRAGVVYAVSMYFDDSELSSRLRVVEGMRTIGLDLLEYVY
ncbi:serine hydrolase [Gryllotalpicola reticulitermitis]|uniref:Serine hydrolase n=1 Tax=Gryllotalpicola reticulitermitis TaxID=1184153 RepID=A0ABV8Q6Z7_9MICO